MDERARLIDPSSPSSSSSSRPSSPPSPYTVGIRKSSTEPEIQQDSSSYNNLHKTKLRESSDGENDNKPEKNTIRFPHNYKKSKYYVVCIISSFFLIIFFLFF